MTHAEGDEHGSHEHLEPEREGADDGGQHGPSGLPPVAVHSRLEDAVATLIGTYVASLGVFLLHSGGDVTGGTAGLALLLGYASGWSFGLVFLLVNLPFLALGVWQRGIGFGVRTLIAIGLVGGFTELHAMLAGPTELPSLYAAITGNLLVGISMLILFRHNASMGGLNTLALLAQDRFGWSAGYVQLACDVVIIAAALAVVPPLVVLVSAFGAGILNLVLVMNHRPGRYLGASLPGTRRRAG